MDWNRLDRQHSIAVLERITTAADPGLFSQSSSEASFKPLSFYQNFMLYRVTNYATLPSFSLDFLSDGESFHLLDGSPDPIFNVNAQGSLYLTEINITDYVDFYLSNVIGEDGDIYMIRNPDDLPFIDSLNPDQQIELKNRHKNPEVAVDQNTGDFIILADLFYGGTLLKAAIVIAPSGDIEIQPRDMLMSAQYTWGAKETS